MAIEHERVEMKIPDKLRKKRKPGENVELSFDFFCNMKITE